MLVGWERREKAIRKRKLAKWEKGIFLGYYSSNWEREKKNKKKKGEKKEEGEMEGLYYLYWVGAGEVFTQLFARDQISRKYITVYWLRDFELAGVHFL